MAPRLLTEDTLTKLTAALSGCATVNDACRYAGISRDLFYEWRARGQRYDEHLTDGGEIIDGEDAYRLMYLAVGEARAKARIRASGTIADLQSDKYPPNVRFRAAAFYLERTDPEHWGRKIIRVEGPDGGPIVGATVTELEVALSESLEPYLAEIRKTQPAPVAIEAASRVLPTRGDQPGDAGGGETVVEPVHRPAHRPSRFRPPPVVE